MKCVLCKERDVEDYDLYCENCSESSIIYSTLNTLYSFINAFIIAYHIDKNL